MADPQRMSARRPLRLRTERLELVAVDYALAVAQLDDRMHFFRLLGVRPTPEWPPPLLGFEELNYTRDRLARNPDEAGWQAWIWIDPVDALGAKELIGFGGFNGPPDVEGVIEIGYSVLPTRERQGYATEATNALLAWAVKDRRVRTLLAYTRADGLASQRVLQKQGFAVSPDRPSPDYLRWERKA